MRFGSGRGLLTRSKLRKERTDQRPHLRRQRALGDRPRRRKRRASGTKRADFRPVRYTNRQEQNTHTRTHSGTGNVERKRFADSISVHTEALELLLTSHEPPESGGDHTPLDTGAPTLPAEVIIGGGRFVETSTRARATAITRTSQIRSRDTSERVSYRQLCANRVNPDAITRPSISTLGHI